MADRTLSHIGGTEGLEYQIRSMERHYRDARIMQASLVLLLVLAGIYFYLVWASESLLPAVLKSAFWLGEGAFLLLYMRWWKKRQKAKIVALRRTATQAESRPAT